jgi:hypothetical protein
VLTNPFIAAGLFIGSLWVFYYTDLFRWSLADHLGHQWMIAHFLITGYLFALTLIGIDPVPWRLPHPGRLLLLIVIMAMHAFFGIAIMMQSGLMVADWFGSMGRTWGPTPLEDQYTGGIAWSIGEIPTLILAITVAIQWSRSDDRETKRRDRHADRTGRSRVAGLQRAPGQPRHRDARRGPRETGDRGPRDDEGGAGRQVWRYGRARALDAADCTGSPSQVWRRSCLWLTGELSTTSDESARTVTSPSRPHPPEPSRDPDRMRISA